ncbi:MAG: ParB/RepB/Spo0J family partition protein [Oscillospiraceae bacterium]|nr:ParB/RepB/Spo0J family partition protein [Oscillospiraceae bacterium]
MNTITYIPIDKLHPHPDNPRKSLGDLTELAESIKATGVLQNLTVVPWFSELTKRPADDPKQQAEMGYRVIIGHRRMAAARLAGLEELPCVITDIPYKEQLATMLLENMQRSDLTVYEQAEGFQLMIDLGESVSGIAEKTGFSESTVRRRLKMSELDKNTLKEVSERQIEMKDFDKLAQIEDINERNAVLKSIGTPNFSMEAEKKLKAQAIAKVLPDVKSALRKAGAKKIEQRQTWNGELTEIQGTEIKLSALDIDTFKVPGTKGTLFYYLDENIGRLRFFTQRKRAAPQKRPQEELDKERAIKEAHRRCEEISEIAYKLRADFVKGLKLTAKNKDLVIQGAAMCIAYSGICYTSVSSTEIYKLAGIENDWKEETKRAALDTLNENYEGVFPQLVYEGFCDVNESYHTTYKAQRPEHKSNIKLDLLYRWLTSLGYEMSDDEKAMQDGTHEVFKEE